MKIEDLFFEEESSTLDFKQEQYPFFDNNEHKKSELLKDILAFANAWKRNDAYILIGVEEVKGGKSKVLGIENNLDDSSLQQFVNSKTQRPVTFEYKNISMEGKNIGLIIIPVNERPFYVRKDYGKVKKNIVYIRRGSSTDEATPDEIAKMGSSNQLQKDFPLLEFYFSNRNEKSILDNNIYVNSKILELPDFKDIKDYEDFQNYDTFNIMRNLYLVNKDYYRELCKYYYFKTIINPISFCIRNISETIATDIKIEIIVDSSNDSLEFMIENKLPEKPRISYENTYYIKSFQEQMSEVQTKPDIMVKQINNLWHIDVFFQKVQPSQTVFTKDLIYLILKDENIINFKFKVFADELSIPIEGNLIINGKINKQKSSLDEILELEKKYILEKISKIKKDF